MVREALTLGPRRGEDTITPHTRPPTDEDASHVLVRTIACIEGHVEVYTGPTGPGDHPDYRRRRDYGRDDELPLLS